jgi:hypothetical protein
MVIEAFRELIDNNRMIDKELGVELDKGPKRIRPPTREELRIELRRHLKEMETLKDEYFLLNP